MKQTLTHLAIFGAPPAFEQKLHVGRPNVGHREHFLKHVNDILDRRWFTNDGPCVLDLERKIADYLGAKHCIVMCNGTIALEIAIRAVGLTGEVIVPSMTFIATAHALQWQEITPVFCDIDPQTHNLNPDRIEALITPRTSGIIGVHLWGRPCDTECLAKIANRHHLKLLYDAAHAFACSYQGRMIGNFGEAEVFSFHATKFFNTLEGGAVVTNNDELADKIHLMKNFGFTGYDNVCYIGTNGKMNEVSAAMGLVQLENLDELIDINHQHYRQYRAELAEVPGLTLVHYNENERCNCQYIVLEIDPDILKINRDLLVKILIAENVMARRYFYPGCHRMEPYHSYFPHAGLLLPETEKLVERVFSLPTGTAITSDDISQICQIIRFVVDHQQEVLQQLNEDSP